MPKFNPFRPGSIVHPGMFAGRIKEIQELEKALFQTTNGNPVHFLIHGERGIGKSSLLMYVNAIARGSIESLDDKKYAFMTISVELEPNDTYGEIISKIARELQRELDKDQALQKGLKDLWDFITKWKVCGIEYKRDEIPTKAMLEELADKLVVIGAKLAEAQRGIYIFIDEADKPPADAGLGEFVKVLTERLTKQNASNVALGIIGISDVIPKMKKSHESSVRILTPILLEPLQVEDRKRVVRRGLHEARNKTGVETKITEEALDTISGLSEGYPHFIQQYAYCAFDHDADNEIDVSDVTQGLTKENGALELLGQRYFENMYTDEIRSDDYRKVLQVIAQQMPNDVTRQEIVSKSGLKRHTVNNALNALKRRGSVQAVRGKMGLFRLPSKSFAVWIQAFKVAK